MIEEHLRGYPEDVPVRWVQEEPQNMGAWQFVDRRVEAVLGEIGYDGPWPAYIGRPESAATATGLMDRHLEEQVELVDRALTAQEAGRMPATVVSIGRGRGANNAKKRSRVS